MFETYRRLQRQRAAGEIDGGFTLIELLIVIVVLGILAAIVVFALGSVTGKSAAAACQSDAKTVGVGVSAMLAENPQYATSGISTTQFQALMILSATGSPTPTDVKGFPFVQTWPNSSSYSISVSDGSTAPATAVENNAAHPLTAVPTAAGTYTAPYGDVLVTSKTAGSLYTYDATVDPTEACTVAVTGKF